MQTLYTFRLLLFLVVAGVCFRGPLLASETKGTGSYITGGIGIEQLSYQEMIPDLELLSSDTELVNIVVHLEAQKATENFFIRAKLTVPLSNDSAQESWTRQGEFEQSNSLTYQRTQADAQVGYHFNRLLSPYIGMHWSYAEQERSNFEIAGQPEIIYATAKEEVYALSALLGIQGIFPLTPRWSLSYYAEYMLPFYSKVTNNNLAGWEASNIEGYASVLAGRLHYAFNETFSATLEIAGGRQHWEGSDWIRIGDSRVKWPENDTHSIRCHISLVKYF